jgi:type I restriction enzyme S subunit
MNADTLLKNFEILSEACIGIDRLRELILNLAVNGRLSTDFDSWITCTLGEVAKIRTGKLDANASSPDGEYPFFTCAREPLRISSYSYDTECVLLAGNGNFDVNYYSGKFDAYQRTYIIEAKNHDELYVPYIFRFMQSYSKKLGEQSIGGVIKYIKISFLTDALILLPTLLEQKRIVAKVDELMALCDQLEQQQELRDNLRTATRKSAIDAISTATTPEELEAAWKRINNNWDVIADTPESIESLRELILDLAVRGDLGSTDISAAKTPTLWDVKEQKLDADKLWKLGTMHVNPANGWSRLPLARLGTWGSGGTPTASRKEFYNNGSIPWAVIGDLNNGIMTDTSSKITRKALASSSAKLIPKNAVLIAMYGASIGKTAITGIECTTNQAIAHCIVDESVVSAEYFFLVAKSLKKHLIKVGKGAAQPNISQTVLKHLLIDVPQLNAQQIVVSKVNEFMAVCDQLESELKARSEVAEKFARSAVNAA